jgi:hypothetical protein
VLVAFALIAPGHAGPGDRRGHHVLDDGVLGVWLVGAPPAPMRLPAWAAIPPWLWRFMPLAQRGLQGTDCACRSARRGAAGRIRMVSTRRNEIKTEASAMDPAAGRRRDRRAALVFERFGESLEDRRWIVSFGDQP